MKKQISATTLMIALILSLSQTYVHAEDAASRVERVCMTMRVHMDKPQTLKGFTINNSSEINAWTDLNGIITFTTGMINFVESDDEIAVVCGHEMAHLSANHMKRNMFTSILAVFAGKSGGGGKETGYLVSSRQSRKHEREADRLGLIYLWESGRDPRTTWKFWERMMSNSSHTGGVFKYVADHPEDSERIENLKSQTMKVCNEYGWMKYCDDILPDGQYAARDNNQ